jgi:hypothetical protein
MLAMLTVTLRVSEPADEEAIRRLAERDSAAVPPGPHLIAIRDGVLEAVISLAGGAMIADPFRHTADSRELLRLAAKRARRERKVRPGLRIRPVLEGRLA